MYSIFYHDNKKRAREYPVYAPLSEAFVKAVKLSEKYGKAILDCGNNTQETYIAGKHVKTVCTCA